MHLSPPTRLTVPTPSGPESGNTEPSHASFREALTDAGKQTPAGSPPPMHKECNVSRSGRIVAKQQAGTLNDSLQSARTPYGDLPVPSGICKELMSPDKLVHAAIASAPSSASENAASPFAQNVDSAERGRDRGDDFGSSNPHVSIASAAQGMTPTCAVSAKDIPAGFVDAGAPLPEEMVATTSDSSLLADQQAALRAPADLASPRDGLPDPADSTLKQSAAIHMQDLGSVILRSAVPAWQTEKRVSPVTGSADLASPAEVLRTVNQASLPSAPAPAPAPAPASATRPNQAEAHQELLSTSFNRAVSSSLGVQEADLHNHSQQKAASGQGAVLSLLEAQILSATTLSSELSTRAADVGTNSGLGTRLRSGERTNLYESDLSSLSSDSARVEKALTKFSADAEASFTLASIASEKISMQVVTAPNSNAAAIPIAQPDIRTVTGDGGPERDPGIGPENVLKTQLIHNAKLIQSVSGSEMRVGLHSLEFGDISIHTSVGHQGLSTQIMLEHDSLGQALSKHIPAMQARLREEYGMTSAVAIHGQSTSSSGTKSEDSQNSDDRRAQRALGQRSQGRSENTNLMAPIQGIALLADLESSRLSIRI